MNPLSIAGLGSVLGSFGGLFGKKRKSTPVSQNVGDSDETWFGNILSQLGTGLGHAGGLGLGGWITDRLYGKPKGVPMPSGSELGKQAADYYANAFPGTTPWERLGAGNPSGQIGSVGSEIKSAQKLQRQQQRFDRSQLYSNLTTQRLMNRENNVARVLEATTPYGARVTQQALNALISMSGKKLQDYDTQIKINRDKAPSEIFSNEYGNLSKINIQALRQAILLLKDAQNSKNISDQLGAIDKAKTLLQKQDIENVNKDSRVQKYRYNQEFRKTGYRKYYTPYGN